MAKTLDLMKKISILKINGKKNSLQSVQKAKHFLRRVFREKLSFYSCSLLKVLIKGITAKSQGQYKIKKNFNIAKNFYKKHSIFHKT